MFRTINILYLQYQYMSKLNCLSHCTTMIKIISISYQYSHTVKIILNINFQSFLLSDYIMYFHHKPLLSHVLHFLSYIKKITNNSISDIDTQYFVSASCVVRSDYSSMYLFFSSTLLYMCVLSDSTIRMI